MTELWERVMALMQWLIESINAGFRRVFDPVEFITYEQISHAAVKVAQVFENCPVSKNAYREWQTYYMDDVIRIDLQGTGIQIDAGHIRYGLKHVRIWYYGAFEQPGTDGIKAGQLVFEGDNSIGEPALCWRGQWIPHLITLRFNAEQLERLQAQEKRLQNFKRID